jgi:hypothetical protein
MYTPRGAALVHRLRKAINKRKETKPMQTTFNKVADIPRVCKGIADTGSTSLSEAELTAAITVYAKHIHPNEKPDAAFAKVYAAQDEIGLAFRRATQIAKGMMQMPIMPVYVGGNAVDVGGPEDALAQLEALVAQMRAASPEMAKLSHDQVFAKVYSDPANRHLAAAERRQSRARLG